MVQLRISRRRKRFFNSKKFQRWQCEPFSSGEDYFSKPQSFEIRIIPEGSKPLFLETAIIREGFTRQSYVVRPIEERSQHRIGLYDHDSEPSYIRYDLEPHTPDNLGIFPGSWSENCNIGSERGPIQPLP